MGQRGAGDSKRKSGKRADEYQAYKPVGPAGGKHRGETPPVQDKEGLGAVVLPGRQGGRRSRRELAELLWLQSDERHARTDLRSALAKLKKTLGEGDAHEEE